LNSRAAEVVIREVEHLQVPVHRQASVWLESKHDVMQVFVFKATCAKENYLKFLSLGDELSEQADFFRLILIRLWLDLVGLVGTSWNRIARSEVLSEDGVPVKEDVGHWAVIFSEIADKSSHLRVSKAVIAEPSKTREYRG